MIMRFTVNGFLHNNLVAITNNSRISIISLLLYLSVYISGCAMTQDAIKDASRQADKGDYLEATGRLIIGVPVIAMIDALTFGTLGSNQKNYSSNYNSQNSSDVSLALANTMITGASYGLNSNGSDASKIAAGLAAAGYEASSYELNNKSNRQITANSSTMVDNYNSDTSSSSSDMTNNRRPTSRENSKRSTVVNSNCPGNFNHLSTRMPAFTDPMLSKTRSMILNYKMETVISDAKGKGWSVNQAISMAKRQADAFEDTAQQNARAASGVSTYLTPKAIVTGVSSGRLSLSLACSSTSLSMVQAAECEVIRDVWQGMWFREIAELIPECW